MTTTSLKKHFTLSAFLGLAALTAACGGSNAQGLGGYDVNGLPVSAPYDHWDLDNHLFYANRAYSNVTKDGMNQILDTAVYVRSGNGYKGRKKELRHISVTAYIDGQQYECFGHPPSKEPYSYTVVPYWVVEKNHKQRNYLAPFLKTQTLDPLKGHQIVLRYKGETGQLAIIKYYKEFDEWIEAGIGHLQRDLPAAVYTLCPDFPSAKSLGLKVNAAQTEVLYDKLVAQDPGDRIKRPDLVVSQTARPYDPNLPEIVQ